MKKTLVTVAAMAMFSTAALAEDFDNTVGKLTVESEAFSLSVSAPKTGAEELEIATPVQGVTVSGKVARDGDTMNYQLKAGKTVDVAATPLYVGGSGAFNFGDSYTSDTRTVVLEGTVGAKTTINNLTPFAEVGYSFKSTTNDIVDFSRDASFVKVGASYAVSPTVALNASVKEVRDINFKNPGDAQAEVGLTIRF